MLLINFVKYKERYYTMYGPSAADAPPTTDHKHRITTHNSKLDALLGSYINDESDSDGEDKDKAGCNTGRKHSNDPARPWLQGFHDYLNTREHLGNSTVVQWWGMHSARYPVWGSLARDFLPIMASSISSERVFSSAGITISKHHNRLKADIIEALQFLKCATKSSDTLVHDAPSLAAEMHGKLDSDNDAEESEEEWDGNFFDDE